MVAKSNEPLDPIDRRIVNHMQGGFPLVPRPFLAVAQELGLDEADLIARVQSLLERGVLSRFGPLYDAARLGGGFTLAAMAVPEARFEAVAELVNAYPEVAHNYRREHALNMWFVVGCETPERIPQVLSELDPAQALDLHYLSGPLDAYQRLEFLRFHTDRHYDQVERLKRTEGFPAQ